MILFEVNARGEVKSTPSRVAQGISMSDLVVLTEDNFDFVTMRLFLPSGELIEDVQFTCVQTEGGRLWHAFMPAKAVKVHGILGYQIFARGINNGNIKSSENPAAVPARLTTNRGVVNVEPGIIDADMPETAEDLGAYTLDSIYNMLDAIRAQYGNVYNDVLMHCKEIYGTDMVAYETPSRIDILDEQVKGLDDDINGENGLSGKMQVVEEQLEGMPKDTKAVKNAIDRLDTSLASLSSDLANFLDVDDHTRDQLSEVLGLISANEQAIKQFVNMGGAPVGSGTLVVPASEWSDGSPKTAFVNLPANTLHAGSVMLLTPANDATKEAASKAGLSVSVDASGDYGDEVNDILLLLRAETAAKPAIDMEFAYVILQTTATTSLVTLIGVDAAGSSDGGDKAAGYLVSTGDTTDRLAEIQALLDNNGYVKLGKGEFYLSGQLRVRNGATLDGCGKATVIKQTPDSTQSSMIWLQSEGTIRNVCLQGEWTAKPTNETAYTSRRIGIVITGGTNNAIIDGCWFIGWTGQAILATTNSAATRSFLMSNCDVRWNNVGLKTAESEYACITNCTFRENITGVLNNGGNNKFVCCGFDSNYDGFVINDGYNNGHGSCNGCTFNHNTHYAVNMAYTEFGFVFSGCNFAEGTIRNTKSKGIMFSGCRFGNWMKYNNYTTNPTLFSGCIFSHSPQTESSEWLDTYGGYKFTGCYNYNTGESVDNIPVAAPETWSFTLEDGSTITKDVMLDV